ncbi:tRNA pseudouridine(38-40) synthase TruA [Candidatus Xianfuyuplasma coldseepsis]|uniref:tRNA pseudouridine synthase A n=1 Tax=Candidatus Xianfuyuplasma coldseepsis TaxID=2782163 RepID=A0A7L7KTC6_9MOLU|nr:tRNA pseudouridine(38-40) synthase TruA [Xianfuyuplasma coldseepsis]QMS85214.1 tRNA pseudouridine(38-40) synthase TruA [Xianfuyuplasma coldseepsis]
MIERFLNAWETSHQDILESLFSDHLFGARFASEDVFYDKASCIEYMMKHPIKRTILTTQSSGTTVLYEMQEDNKVIVGKMVIDHNHIVKLYETVKQNTIRIKAVCSYDGSDFLGYQRQATGQTIQGTIEMALYQGLNLQEPPTIHASGRTDKAVHAKHQVFHTDINTNIPVSKMARLINSYLPDSIHIHQLEEVPQTFHSRFDVLQKTYQYRINTKTYNPIQRNYEWFVNNLDPVRLQSILNEIKGTHDFQSFTTSTDQSTIRTISDVVVEPNDSHIVITITGDGFLRYMVRYIVYAAVSITQNKLPYTMTELVNRKDPNLLKEMAPASGLYLDHIMY